MLNISAQLAETIEAKSQYVKPKVVARFGDNRHLKNLSVESSNDSYSKLVSSLEPSLHWQFENKRMINALNEIRDYSGNNYNGQILNASNAAFDLPFARELDYKISNIDDNFNKKNFTDLSDDETVIITENIFADSNNTIPYLTNVSGNRWFIFNQKITQTIPFQPTEEYVDSFFGISADKVGGTDYALVESGSSDGVISATFGGFIRTTSSNPEVTPRSNQGLIVRFINNKNFIAIKLEDILTTAKVKIIQKYNNTNTELININTNASWTTLDVLKVKFVGNEFIVYKNNTIIGSTRISNINASPLGTAHGMGGESISLGSTNLPDFGAVGAVWQNFKLEAFNCKNYSFRSITATPASSSGYVSLQDAQLTTGSKATVALAVKSGSFSTAQTWLELVRFNETPFPTQVSRFEFADSTLTVYVAGSTNTINDYYLTYTPPSLPSVDQWHLIVLTRDGQNLNLFFDGVLVDSISNYNDSTLFSDVNALLLSSQYNTININFDHLFILNDVIDSDLINKLYNYKNLNQTFFDGQSFFSGSQAFNTIEQESYPFAVLDQKTKFNKKIISNGEYHLLGNRVDLENEYNFQSWQKSDSSGIFADDPYIHAKFDATKATRIAISTGVNLTGVSGFTLEYHIASQPAGVFEQVVDNFSANQSVISIPVIDENGNEIIIDEVKLTVGSTKNPNAYAVINQINIYYEVDLSDDVISFDFSKVRDNYEATLPIGSTSANNGSVSLDNTHQKYNLFNPNSPYFGYIQPEVKVFLSLLYEIDENVYEEVPLGSDLFVESWNVSSDSMSVDLSVSDWSVVLQDLTAKNGFVFEDIVAGRACRDVVRSTGFPVSKINYYDSFHRTILQDEPDAYWRLNDSGSVVNSNITVADEGGIYDATLAKPGGSTASRTYIRFGASAIVEQEKNVAIDNNARTLAALYQITAENVGLESPKKYWTNYSTSIDTAGAAASANPCLEAAGPAGLLGGTTAFAIEAVIKPSALVDANERSIVSQTDGNNNAANIYVVKAGNTYYIKASTRIGTTTTTCERGFSESNFVNKVFHIVFVKNANEICLYVNGVADRKTGSASAVNSVFSPIRMLRKNFDNSSLSFNGQISHVAIYKRNFSEVSVIRHYEAFKIKRLPLFPYLYFFETSYWDGMLEIATGDVGMFYFDEYGNFVYNHKNAFHEEVLDQHYTTQHFFDVNTNIKSANHVIDVQTNKIQIKVNPKTKINTGVSSLWRADTDESLAVTKITASVSSTETEIFAENTENPIWPISGYFKIDNEIIKYNNREINKFTELERGQFGTIPSAHLSNALCREVRSYSVEFVDKPAVSVRFPFIAAQIYEGRVDVDKFETTPFGGTVVVSASQSASNVPATETTASNLVFLEGKNPITELEYVFSIAGIPLTEKVSEERVQEELRTVDPNAKQLRPKELIVDNKFVQTTNYAREIANFILKFFGMPVPIINIDTIGVPHLQLGDLIEIENMPDLNITNKQYWIIETSIQYDGGVNQSFVLREKTNVI